LSPPLATLSCHAPEEADRRDAMDPESTRDPSRPAPRRQSRRERCDCILDLPVPRTAPHRDRQEDQSDQVLHESQGCRRSHRSGQFRDGAWPSHHCGSSDSSVSSCLGGGGPGREPRHPGEDELQANDAPTAPAARVGPSDADGRRGLRAGGEPARDSHEREPSVQGSERKSQTGVAGDQGAFAPTMILPDFVRQIALETPRGGYRGLEDLPSESDLGIALAPLDLAPGPLLTFYHSAGARSALPLASGPRPQPVAGFSCLWGSGAHCRVPPRRGNLTCDFCTTTCLCKCPECRSV
jgi:hypothetical protein